MTSKDLTEKIKIVERINKILEDYRQISEEEYLLQKYARVGARLNEDLKTYGELIERKKQYQEALCKAK
ncbi:MAG: hypothetical protein KC516_02920 [Nanoarchaeota archaeon]|nr:hypothetical protein [Nanoarchaeota archaeon]